MAVENRSNRSSETSRVSAVLDNFHTAASEADEERYLGCLTPDAVFIGTDASERWAGADFRDFVHSFFSRDKGWTYTPSTRNVAIGDDGTTAWFDELLDSEWYGDCRGTGVLQLKDDVWRIEQYCLTIPIPNEIADEVVAKIRGR
jgi:ketosteroid isomerase-like protein